MVILAGFLTAALCFIEFKIYRSAPRLGKILEEHKLAQLVFSVALGYVLGAMFDATGLIALVAGIGSTMVMSPVYKAMRAKDNHTLRKAERRVQAGKYLSPVQQHMLDLYHKK